MRAFLTSACVSIGLALCVPACGDDDDVGVLQAADLKAPEGEVTFNRNLVVDLAAFTDVETTALGLESIQGFLSRSPYERPSFLETYQSNGVRASDAIIAAARNHRINPIVFLVFAQITQGLVGERNYPFPPERVEYVFQCGCLQADNCRPDRAGFDRQVDCLGKALRTALDEMRAEGQTTSGWGKDITRLTLDELKVTPENEATAALYDRLPRVNEGEGGGSWVFWNVWNKYAETLDYTGTSSQVDGRWIGDACISTGQCGIPDGICALNYPGGICTVPCTGECPTASGKAEGFCAKFRDGGYCFPTCNPSAPACREGYRCVNVQGVADGASKHVCTPSAAQ